MLLPPVGNIAYKELRPLFYSPKPIAAITTSTVSSQTEQQLHDLQLNVKDLTHQLETLQKCKLSNPQFFPKRVRILPLMDSSSQRDSRWITCDSKSPIPEKSVIVIDRALIGRVHNFGNEFSRLSLSSLAIGGRSLARIQTCLDPYFRVRFRFGDYWGFLRGTGRVDDRTGNPLLSVELINDEVYFKEGQKIYTDGNDGIYPEGILIGEIVRKTSLGATKNNGKNKSQSLEHSQKKPGNESQDISSTNILVRCEINPDDHREAVVLIDPVMEAVRDVQLEDGS